MPSVIYKPLFEVKILHEFFLTRSDGSSLFDKTPSQKAVFLQEEFSANSQSVNEWLEFEFPSNKKQSMETSYLKIIPSFSGFKVVVKVLPKLQSDGQMLYQPVVPLSANQDIFIQLSRKGPIDSVTNGRIIRPVPTIYYFTNADLPSTRNFPFLTNPIAAYDPGYSYEQGELSDESGNLREFQKKGNPDDIFFQVVGAGFAGEGDRLLVPDSFVYRFPDLNGLNTAEFILRDWAGNEISRSGFSGADNISAGIKINYTGKVVSPAAGNSRLVDALYQLEVRGNNGYRAVHRLLFDQAFADAKPWAVIHLKQQTNNPLFSLIDETGFLKTRKNILGDTVQTPLFEIPVKSRLVYFRYVHNRGEKLEISPSMQNYLEEEGNNLIALTPNRLSNSFFKIRKENDVSLQYAPNPVNYDIKKSAAGVFYCELTVNHSKFFQA